MVKSLVDGEWNVLDVISMLEGGNRSFLQYMTKKLNNRTGLLCDLNEREGDMETAFQNAFNRQYDRKSAAVYGKLLSKRVSSVLDMHKLRLTNTLWGDR